MFTWGRKYRQGLLSVVKEPAPRLLSVQVTETPEEVMATVSTGGISAAFGYDSDRTRQGDCLHAWPGRSGGAAHSPGGSGTMIGLPVGTRLWIVAGITDMRRGFISLAGMVQTAL